MSARAIAAALLIALAAPAAVAEPMPEATARYGPADAPTRLLVRSTTDIALFGEVLAGFVAAQPGLVIEYEQWGSNDLYAVAAAACRDGEGAADLVISSALDLQVKLVNDGCARPHRSAATAALPASANWRNEVFGVTSEPAVLVYNRALVPASEAPLSRFDLLDLLRPAGSRYAGRVATYDIEASGLGYLFAFADSQQATTFGSLIEAFGRTGAVATCCSAEIIDGVVSGRYLIAYNVLGSYALQRARKNPDLAIVAPADYTLMLRRAALIPRQATHPDAAGRLIDFLLSDAGRRALTRAHLLVNMGDGEAGEMQIPGGDEAVLRPIPLSPVLLVGLDRQKRARFLQLWRQTFPTFHGTGPAAPH